MLRRYELTDQEWNRIKDFCLLKKVENVDARPKITE